MRAAVSMATRCICAYWTLVCRPNQHTHAFQETSWANLGWA